MNLISPPHRELQGLLQAVIFLCCVPLLASGSGEQDSASKADGAVGFIDRTGKIVIDPEFDYAERFSEGLSAVRNIRDSKWGYIDHTGSFVVAPRFDMAQSFSEGRAAVSVEAEGGRSRWGYIDRSGKVVVEPAYLTAEPFFEGLAVVGWLDPGQPEPASSWRSGYIDGDGNLAISLPQEYHGQSFVEGYAIVWKNNKLAGFIDRTGRVVVPAKYKMAWAFSEGLASVQDEDGKYGFVAPDGRVVIPHELAFAGPFHGGLAKVKVGGKFGYMDRQGQVAIPAKFSQASDFNEGFALVKCAEGQCLIDRSGTARLWVNSDYELMSYWSDARMHRWSVFSEGLAVAINAESWDSYGFVDRKGNVAIEMRFSEVFPFTEGLAAFSTRKGHLFRARLDRPARSREVP